MLSRRGHINSSFHHSTPKRIKDSFGESFTIIGWLEALLSNLDFLRVHAGPAPAGLMILLSSMS